MGLVWRETGAVRKRPREPRPSGVHPEEGEVGQNREGHLATLSGGEKLGRDFHTLVGRGDIRKDKHHTVGTSRSGKGEEIEAFFVSDSHPYSWAFAVTDSWRPVLPGSVSRVVSGRENSLLWVTFHGRVLSARLAVGLADDGRARPRQRRWHLQSQVLSA